MLSNIIYLMLTIYVTFLGCVTRRAKPRPIDLPLKYKARHCIITYKRWNKFSISQGCTTGIFYSAQEVLECKCQEQWSKNCVD